MDDTANTFETNSISVRDFLPNKLNLSPFGAWRTDRLLSGEKRGPGSIPLNIKCNARFGEKIIRSQASSSLFSCVIPLSPWWRVPHWMQKPHCGSSYNYVKKQEEYRRKRYIVQYYISASEQCGYFPTYIKHARRNCHLQLSVCYYTNVIAWFRHTCFDISGSRQKQTRKGFECYMYALFTRSQSPEYGGAQQLPKSWADWK
jgi:hypothetical protein